MNKLSLLPMMVVASVVAAASPLPSPRRAAYPIEARQVASAISAQGVAVSAGQVEFLAAVVSATPAPRLEVASVEPWGARRSRVLLGCHEAGECLPFYVAVSWKAESAAQVGLRQWSERTNPVAKKMNRREPPLVRAGGAATLIIESGRIHMQLPVICLENGVLGSKIRVTSKDRKKIFVAQVMSGNIVKGGIQ